MRTKRSTSQRTRTNETACPFGILLDPDPDPSLVRAGVLSIRECRDLLGSCADPLAALHLVLPLFAGLPLVAIRKLTWDAFKSGRTILVPPLEPGAKVSDNDGNQERRVPLLHTLDAWLKPFYGADDNLFVDNRLLERTASVLRSAGVRHVDSLRRTFIAHGLLLFPEILPDCLYVRPGELKALRLPSPSPVDLLTAHATVSLTPASVDITDWPERVARALQNYSAPN